MKKRVLCFVVSLALVFTLMPMVASADVGTENNKSSNYRIGMKGNPQATSVVMSKIGSSLQLTVYDGNREASNLSEWEYQIKSGNRESVELDRNTGEVITKELGTVYIDGVLFFDDGSYINAQSIEIIVGRYYVEFRCNSYWWYDKGDYMEYLIKQDTELAFVLYDRGTDKAVTDFEEKGFKWEISDLSAMDVENQGAQVNVFPTKPCKGIWVKVLDSTGNNVALPFYLRIEYAIGTDVKTNDKYLILPDDGTACTYTYSKNKSNRTIPNTISLQSNLDDKTNKYKITEINNLAFSKNTKLKKITIGSNVTKIGEQAFYKAKNLKTIIVKSKKLKTVGKNAFKGINKKGNVRCAKQQDQGI